MPNQRRHAPAFGPRRSDADQMPPPRPSTARSNQPVTSETRPFAPAFGRKPQIKKEEDEPHASGSVPFEFMLAPSFENTQSTWTTYDPTTKEVKWETEASQSGAAASESLGIWNNYGHGEVNDASTSIRDTNSLFIPVSNILDAQTGPRNEFEKRNTNTLAIGRNNSRIVNMIGDRVVSTIDQKVDDRLKYLGEDGSYTDGVNRGQVKKRYLEEQQRRVQQRREEIVQYNQVMAEWNALSKEEQEARKKKAQENNKVMLERLQIEEIQEVPDAYLHKVQDLSIHIPEVTDSDDEEPLFVTGESEVDEEEYTAERNLALGLKRRLSPQSISWEDESSTPSRKPSRGYQKDRSTPASSGKNRRSSYVQIPRPRHDATQDQNKFVSAPTGPKTSQIRQSSFKLLLRMKYTPRPVPIKSAASANTFKVTKWPEMLPVQDLVDRDHPIRREEISDPMFKKVQKFSKGNGRLVILSLVDGVEFTGEAVVQRVFGGVIQDVQLFPDDRLAAIFFLNPWDAAAYVRHVECAREESVQEFRRLQVACDWYKGDEENSYYQCQPQTLVHVLRRNGTRSLHIKNINKWIKQQDLEAIFKAEFSDKRIVKCKMIVPGKRYEREMENSNSVVLEFASIKEAFEVKTLFDMEQVSDFEHCTAEYLEDPVQQPAVAQPYCDCIHCRKDIGNSIVFTGIGPSRTADNAVLLRNVRPTRREGLDYEPQADLRKPEQFDERWHKAHGMGFNIGED